MASFGSFETEREAYSDVIYTVYTARKVNDSGGQYAVKVFRLPDRGLEAEVAGGTESHDELECARLSSIDVQQEAAAGSPFVAPVLERGNDSRGLWYATRFYPRSVNRMMSGKVALPRASLEHVIRSIAQGALDMKRLCGRSHGDIQLTNVQVGKSEKLTDAEVVLSDPRPGEVAPAEEYELSDLHAIGWILLQLVRQRIINKEDAALMFPIAPGPEWTHIFGSDASDWLAICNRLLNPNLGLSQFNLEALVARLRELEPPRRGSPKSIAAAVGVAVLGILTGLLLLRPHKVTVDVTSDPAGATVLVDGVQQAGVTPLRLKLKTGAHRLDATLAQLSPLTTNCAVGRETLSAVHFRFENRSVAIKNVSTVTNGRSLQPTAELRRNETPNTMETAPVVTNNTSVPPVARTGEVEFRAEPLAATIFDASGNQLGQASPLNPLSRTVPAGKAIFVAKAEGFKDVSSELSIEQGAKTQYTFIFDYGTVDWTSEPVSAIVRLGTQSRPTPATFIQAPEATNTYIITAAGYEPQTNVVSVKSGEKRPLVARLIPISTAVALVSEPPGAEFLTEDGTPIVRDRNNGALFSVPSGLKKVVARHPQLGMVTNQVELATGRPGSAMKFNFAYGTLVLTNLPANVTVYESAARIGAAADGVVYQRPGPHQYMLRGPATPQDVQLLIQPGLNYLRLGTSEKSWKNNQGIWFAWVPNLPGGGVWPGQNIPGGWVGVSEVTQGQYKKMDGNNPSVYRAGGDNYPVENVTWEQAMNYCRWLSSVGAAECGGWHYTLPSDEQFDAFAADADRLARVTAEGRMSSALDDPFPFQRVPRIPAAQNLNNARTHPEAVASTKQANQYGLYDVVGNVWEWLARSGGKENVYAGGSYLNFSQKTVGTKARDRTQQKGPNIGFRVILVP
jgi:hypothetical protein